MKAFLILLCVISAGLSARASGYVNEDFTGTTAPGWVFTTGDDEGPYLTAAQGIDSPGDGWLRLTENENNEADFAYYDTAFSSAEGVYIEMAYSIWGGSGADGLVVALFDGSVDSPTAGGYGGSLGYAQRTGVDGLSKAVFGIGLDEFGNFSNPTEGRIGGPGSVPDGVAIRGPGDKQDGYEYITGSDVSGYGSLDFRNVLTRPDQTGDDYRGFRLIISTEKYITLDMKFGADSEYVTIIDQFPYTEEMPDTLKLGFTAGTGGSTNFHEIRTLIVADQFFGSVPEPAGMVWIGGFLMIYLGRKNVGRSFRSAPERVQQQFRKIRLLQTAY